MPKIDVVCRPVSEKDFAGWSALFEGYLEFYHFPSEPEVIKRVWNWLHDPNHPMQGIVADLADEGIVGLAHFTTWPLTLVGTDAGYLSDLYVRENLRGGGIGKALITDVRAEFEKRGWPLLFWLTQETNYRGRRLYDQFTPKSEFIAYMLEPKSDG
ncbi:MAG: GNAT family N-acetyltransferase [Geminicoccales bacterium]